MKAHKRKTIVVEFEESDALAVQMFLALALTEINRDDTATVYFDKSQQLLEHLREQGQ